MISFYLAENFKTSSNRKLPKRRFSTWIKKQFFEILKRWKLINSNNIRRSHFSDCESKKNRCHIIFNKNKNMPTIEKKYDFGNFSSWKWKSNVKFVFSIKNYVRISFQNSKIVFPATLSKFSLLTPNAPEVFHLQDTYSAKFKIS